MVVDPLATTELLSWKQSPRLVDHMSRPTMETVELLPTAYDAVVSVTQANTHASFKAMKEKRPLGFPEFILQHIEYARLGHIMLYGVHL